MAIYIPIVIYGLRLFIVALLEQHCLLNCLYICMIRVRGCYHITKFRCSTASGYEIAKCRLFIVVLHELHVNSLPNCLHVCMLRV